MPLPSNPFSTLHGRSASSASEIRFGSFLTKTALHCNPHSCLVLRDASGIHFHLPLLSSLQLYRRFRQAFISDEIWCTAGNDSPAMARTRNTKLIQQQHKILLWKVFYLKWCPNLTRIMLGLPRLALCVQA